MLKLGRRLRATRSLVSLLSTRCRAPWCALVPSLPLLLPRSFHEQSADGIDLLAARLRRRLSSTPTTWYPIPVSLGVALLVVINFYKQRSWESRGGKGPVPESEIKVKGPWQVSTD